MLPQMNTTYVDDNDQLLNDIDGSHLYSRNGLSNQSHSMKHGTFEKFSSKFTQALLSEEVKNWGIQYKDKKYTVHYMCHKL